MTKVDSTGQLGRKVTGGAKNGNIVSPPSGRYLVRVGVSVKS